MLYVVSTSTAKSQVIHVLHRVSQDAVKNYIVAAADVIFLAGNPANFAFLMLAAQRKSAVIRLDTLAPSLPVVLGRLMALGFAHVWICSSPGDVEQKEEFVK